MERIKSEVKKNGNRIEIDELEVEFQEDAIRLVGDRDPHPLYLTPEALRFIAAEAERRWSR